MTVDEAARLLLARLKGDDAAALGVLLRLIKELRDRQTLGGIPPGFNDRVWKNQTVPGGPDPEYRGI